MTTDALAPKQERSRHTLARLLKATVETLEAQGLDGTTIPKIAAAAGVAPASIYRRFKDRDALLRAAFETALSSGSASTSAITLDKFRDQSLEGVTRSIVSLIVRQYEVAPGLMRAFIRFAEQDQDESFRAHTIASLCGNAESVIALLATFRPDIKHKNPLRALTFAFLTAGTIIEAIKVEEISLWHHLLPLGDDELKEELTRMMLAYLRG